jgi:hypothetical protein
MLTAATFVTEYVGTNNIYDSQIYGPKCTIDVTETMLNEDCQHRL